jgi:DNA-binding transcriptional LysR family regulator
VRLRELGPPESTEALHMGTIDVAIEREPPAEDGIVVMPVLVERFVAAVPRDHALAGRRAIPASALRDEPFVLFPREVAPGLYQQLGKIFRHAGFDPRVMQEADEWQTILSLVEAGIGVSIIPASLRGRRGDALAFPALTGRLVRTTTAARSRPHESSRVVLGFLDVLREVARDAPQR